MYVMYNTQLFLSSPDVTVFILCLHQLRKASALNTLAYVSVIKYADYDQNNTLVYGSKVTLFLSTGHITSVTTQ